MPDPAPAGPAQSGPECYVVSYDHGGLVLWGLDHFIEHLDGLLGWLDRHPSLRMGLDNEAWMYDWLAANEPAVLQRVRDCLARYGGRLAVGSCTYGQPLAAHILEESNIRQVQLGLDTVRERLGCEVSVYSFSEHAAFPQMPQILVGLGISRALLRTHFLMYGYCPGYDFPIAWWQGPDGSRVAAVPTYHAQERQDSGHRAHPPGPFGLTTEDTWILTRYPSAESPDSLDSFASRFRHIRPLVASRLDDSGLKREELVAELDARPEYRWTTLEELFDLLPAPVETMAPSADQFGVRMPWGYRGNQLFDLTRRGEVALLTAERIAAVRMLETGDSAGAGDAEATLDAAWRDLLVAQHHDAQIVARAGAFGRERIAASLAAARAVIGSRLRERAVGAEAEAHTTFNPLPWPRRETYAELADGTAVWGDVSARSLGFAQMRTALEAKAIEGLNFETEHYRAEFGPTGGLIGLRDRSGADLIVPGSPSGGLAAVIGGVPYASAGEVRIERTDAAYHVVERGAVGPVPYCCRWVFPLRGTRIDLHIESELRDEVIGAPAEHDRDSRSCFVHEEKLRVRFYPALDPGRAFGLRDVPFGIEPTENRYLDGLYWSGATDGIVGLALANRGTMGAVREDDGALSVPLAFSTPYVWGREPLSGSYQWAVALLPWTGDWQTAGLHRRALEFAFPLVAIPGRLRGGSADSLRIDNPDVQLTALFTADGRPYARVCNMSPRPQFVGVGWPNGMAVEPVDLRRRPQLAKEDPRELDAWQIRTFLLTPGSQEHDLRDLAGLMAEMETHDRQERARAQEAAIGLLHKVGPNNAARVGQAVTKRLTEMVAFSVDFEWPIFRDVPVLLAALHALSYVGDQRALREVSRLAQRARDHDVRTAAVRCRDRLTEHLHRAHPRRRLLRAASAPTAELVRPAPHQPDDDPELLVRPEDGDG